ncbi:MAG: hypothetical protein B7Z40_04785 [Bosea sp. 12-68-7]|nr:MAG: hypothetical protein B7Z40_04785 [Bosea sp. 12-68-7]
MDDSGAAEPTLIEATVAAAPDAVEAGAGGDGFAPAPVPEATTSEEPAPVKPRRTPRRKATAKAPDDPAS